MRKTRHWLAVPLLALMVLARGQYAFTSAYADWSLCFDDPTTLDLSDINGLIVTTVPFSDPMDVVRQSVLSVLQPSGRILVSDTRPTSNRLPEPNGPRAPPAA